MTITRRQTRRGNVIHLVSFSDLIEAVQCGERLRVYCPIHGSDHQRSLSIDCATGWGFCHSCHATVLVQHMASVNASSQGNRHEPRRVHRGFADTASTVPLSEHSLHPHRERPVQTASSSSPWQQEEVAALIAGAPVMREALVSSWRAQMYLTQRALPPTLVQASGVGYLSRAAWEQASVSKEQQQLLKRWIGRIIFPLGSPGGHGFIGRTLLKWEPGMDENTHKALLDQPGAPRRWIKSNPAGWFGFEKPACLAEWVVLVEGGFDRLTLLAAGMPANTVIALVGTAARPEWLARCAPQMKRVVLALDADNGGAVAMERLAGEFRKTGFTVTQCPPSQNQWGKDWSERFRRLGPQSIWPLFEACSQHFTER
jgi:Toprim domain-containing protein